MIKPDLKIERMDGMGEAGGLNILNGLDDLCNKYKINKTFNILELGSNNGVSTSLFAYYANTVHAIDISLTEKMKKTLTQYDNIIFHHGIITDIMKKVPDNFFDLIYIDADHSYNSVMNDLTLSYPKLKTNGILCGHDYLPDSPTLHGVSRAVNDFFNNLYLDFDKKELCIFSDFSWAVVKR